MAVARGCRLLECRCFCRGLAAREGYSMYHSSSQKRHWTFASEEQLARLRADANRKFKCKAVANGKVRSPRASPSGHPTPGAPPAVPLCLQSL